MFSLDDNNHRPKATLGFDPVAAPLTKEQIEQKRKAPAKFWHHHANELPEHPNCRCVAEPLVVRFQPGDEVAIREAIQNYKDRFIIVYPDPIDIENGRLIAQRESVRPETDSEFRSRLLNKFGFSRHGA